MDSSPEGNCMNETDGIRIRIAQLTDRIVINNKALSFQVIEWDDLLCSSRQLVQV